MRRVFAIAYFGLGCLLAVFAVAWFTAARAGVVLVPRSPGEAVGLFLLYAAVILPTLDRASARCWPPAIPVTPSRVAAARVVMTVSLVLCLASIGSAVLARAFGSESLRNHAFSAVIGSLGLLNGTYVAVHWAYRPENLFGSRMSRALLNPLGSLLVWVLWAVRNRTFRGPRQR